MSVKLVQHSNPINFIAYILIVLVCTILVITFLTLNPQYWGSIYIALITSTALVVLILILALVPMLPLIILITISIIVIALLSRHWVEPLPELTLIINRVLIASIVVVLVFILISFSVYQKYCIEPFLRKRFYTQLPRFRDILGGPKLLLITLEIIELLIIIVLIAIFEPRISQIIGEVLPGPGLQDIMENYPIRNYVITIIAGFGIITSIYDQIKYIDIIQENLMEKCYKEYKKCLYNYFKLDERTKCFLDTISSNIYKNNNINNKNNNTDLCKDLFNRCKMSHNECKAIINQFCNDANVSNIINDIINESSYRYAFCEDTMYNNLYTFCIDIKLVEICEKRKLLRKIRKYIYLAPSIILPIVIAIL
ncbi:MAG: hypothetical protein QXD57_07005 [Ignisphaera sp.]